MNKKLTLALTLVTIAFGGSAYAEGLQLKAKTVNPPPPPAIGNIKANPSGPTTPGGFTAKAIPAVMKCMPGYNKTDEHVNHNGAVDRMECLSPIYECPHKSKVKNSNGSAANGQGIDIVKVPVGNPGDTNRFKIEYTCTYYWAQG